MRYLRLLVPVLLAPVISAEKLCFPDGFLLGSATASYQVEGGWNEGGRTPSIWDDWCRSHAAVQCANVADDFFHRYKADVQLMKDAGYSSFRFSISWSRVMNWDEETERMKPNPPGIAFYHALIDELTKNDIAPILTIYHSDLPSELETKLSPGGWLSPKIQDHFVDYATLLFQEFGHQVNYWATFNEPNMFVMFGYGTVGLANGAGSPPGITGSDTAQYKAGHNVLLSHAKAVQKFRELQAQGVVNAQAKISIVIAGDFSIPMDPKKEADVAAAERVQQFMIGWYYAPMVTGDYPAVMRERANDRLPTFTPEEKAMLKGSYDIFMLNHYSSHLVTDCNSSTSKVDCDKQEPGFEHDLGVDNHQKPAGARNSSVDEDGKELCGYFAGYPEGYRGVLHWVHNLNTSTPILLTENGYCGNAEIKNENQLWYHHTYLEQVYHALVDDKIPIIGYTAWSLMDNYEWGSFKPRFGLYYVNYTSQAGSKESWTPKPTDLARIPRPAATWFATVTKTGCLEPWHDSVGEVADKVEKKVEKIVHSTAAGASDSSSYWISGIVVVIVFAIAIAAVIIRRRRAGSAQEQASLLHE